VTPYAVLLAKPTDSDDAIRKLYHAIARTEHPDGSQTQPSELWYSATAAYTAIKTAEKRAEVGRRQDLLAGRCAACEGTGVKGTRMFKGKIRFCSDCKGEGVV
jgi:DnaJ-class molecular chaperone